MSELVEPGVVDVGFQIVTLDAFVAVFEPGAEALLGTSEQAVLPVNADAMLYGDGGVGKTTLAVDLAFHLAAGRDWLGLPVEQPRTVMLVESEGPRTLFRSKLRRKRESWRFELGDRLHVLEAPWSELSFADPEHRMWLALAARRHDVDLIIAGPVTQLGMDDAGTIQEVRRFVALVDDVRSHAERPVAFLLVHHENKGGRVSGAWEGVGDALLHVQSSGHGRTRLFVQKSRWASQWHAKTLHLTWSSGDAFELDDSQAGRPERVWAAIEQHVREHPGCSWNDVQRAVKGDARYNRERRDAMLAEPNPALVNVAAHGHFELWLATDPARPQGQMELDDEVRRERDDEASHLVEQARRDRDEDVSQQVRRSGVAVRRTPASTPGDAVSAEGATVRRDIRSVAPSASHPPVAGDDDW